MQTVVKIKLEFNNGQSVDNEFVYKDSFLSICDDMIKKIFPSVDTCAIASCCFTIGSDNLSVCVSNYSLTDEICFCAFHNMPMKLHSFQVFGVNIHLVDCTTDLLQLDCEKILLAECRIAQADIGLNGHYEALKSRDSQTDTCTAYTMNVFDIRSCHIETLKTYIQCNYVNVQESTISNFYFYGGFVGKVVAVVNTLNIWQFCQIRNLEVDCQVNNLKVEDSSISKFIAKGKCHIGDISSVSTEWGDAYNFDPESFNNKNSVVWEIIVKSAEHSGNSQIIAEANYNIIKALYQEEKGLGKIMGKVFDFCSGYGYKPLRVFKAGSILIGSVFMLLVILRPNKCKVSQCLAYAVAGIAGQSGLTICNGISFWIVTLEYLLGVILFAVFVNGLYLRYKN